VDPTSLSLLDRLKTARPDDVDWKRLQDIYVPLIRRWLIRVPGLGDEVEDLTQEVFVIIVREIHGFNRQREGSFRTWLRNVTINKLRTHAKQQHRRPAVGLDGADGFLDRLAEPNSELAREWDLDYDRHVFEKLQRLVQSDFAAATWEAFRRFALEGTPPAQVADELGMSVNAVTMAKSRILKRLRQEAGELLK
jgi:RNA polymerase sigma-70 factor (ECF subfamily)